MQVNKQEGEGLASPKVTTAWAVEVDGEISPYTVVRTREIARCTRHEYAVHGHKSHVRKVQINVVPGR